MELSAEDLFRDLYAATSRRLYAYLRRHADPDMAETVLSEVYVKAWRHLSSLTDEPMGWLIVTAKRTLLDHHRAQQRRDRLNDRLFTASRGDTDPGPEEQIVDRQVILEALRQLSDEDREALLLVGWDGLSHSEAARVAGCSVPAFTKRLSRARQRLDSAIGTPVPSPPRAVHREAWKT